MSTELYSRISQIKQYITQLHQHLNANDHQNATSIINKFKKATMKDDPHLHANQFLLDCLKTKNQKLLAQLQHLQLQKKNMQTKMAEKRTDQKHMKPINASIFISRLTVSLNQVKKVQYQDVNIQCDYKNVMVTSLVGNKYKNYPLAVQSIIDVEVKQNYCHLQYQDTMKLNILIKFLNEKELIRWVTCIRFGMMIQSSRKKDKLFQVKKEESAPPVPSTPLSIAPLSTQSPQFMAMSPSQLLLNFKPITSPSQSVSIIQEKRQKSIMDKMEKNTQRSLLTALNNDRADRKSQKPKKPSRGGQSVRDESFANNSQLNKPSRNYIPKYEKNRPSPLLRTRGLSQNHDTFSQIDMSKTSKKIDYSRKNSYDPQLKPAINQINQQVLAKIKQNQFNEEDWGESRSTRTKNMEKDDSKNSSGLSKLTPEQSSHNKDEQPQKSNKIKTIQQKKKQLLTKSIYSQKLQVPTFNISQNIPLDWGIQQIDDQNHSKTSGRLSRRQSIISGQIRYSNDSLEKKETDNDRSQHITQKSEEESPVLPRYKNIVSNIPRQISYTNGPILNIKPVERTKNEEHQNEKNSQNDINKEKSDYSKEQSYSSQSESHAHSDPDSHQNHTQTQDNAARAQELKKGLTLTKCAQNGFWPHEKIVYLSQTQNQLCIRDLSDKKIKKIKMSAITSVDYRKFDKGIMKHISSQKIQNQKCMTIRAEIEDKQLKNFQFYGNNAQALQRFAENLNLFLDYNWRQK